TIDSARVLEDLRYLASGALEGRETGSAGNRMARDYIIAAFTAAGVEPAANGEWIQNFAMGCGSDDGRGTNVLGLVRGTVRPDCYIVVCAHLDHLDTINGTVFHGADDNASGTAALMEIGRQLRKDPSENSVILAALDAEEMGLMGARAFVAS